MTSSTDRQGLALAGSQDAIDAFDRAIDHMLRLQIEMVGEVAGVIEAEPDFAMGNVLLGYMTMLSTDGGDVGGAKELAAQARSVADATTLSPREQAHVATLERWVDGDLKGAGNALDAIAIEHPHDIVALAVGHQIDFFTGDALNLRDRIGRALPLWSADDPRGAFMHGMHAFGLEECNLYSQARDAGMRAISTNADDVWAIHAVTHTYEMQGQIADGLRFADGHRDDWAEGNFLNVHNSWHYALYCLQGDDVDAALAIYDRVLHHAESADVSLELLDATALLWRIHLEGRSVGDRWEPLADAWARCLVPGHYPFNDMHAAMAYVAAGRREQAVELVAALEKMVGGGVAPNVTGAVMTASIGLPICRALVHFDAGDDEAAIAELMPIRRRFQEFGGSHAQRDAIGRTLIEAARRAGNTDLALALLNERLSVRDASSYDWAKRAQLLRATGDHPSADAAQARAEALADEIKRVITH